MEEQFCKEAYQVEGKVVDTLPNAMFKVELENGATILAHCFW